MPRRPLGPTQSRRRVNAALWILVPLMIILVVWQQTSVDRLVVQLEKEKVLHRDLESRVHALRLEANRLSSLEQVEERAQAELGLRRPRTEDIVDLVFGNENLSDPRFRSLVGTATAGVRGEAPE